MTKVKMSIMLSSKKEKTGLQEGIYLNHLIVMKTNANGLKQRKKRKEQNLKKKIRRRKNQFAKV